MANLKLIKDLAAIKGLTIEQLAAKAQITTQAIHLMGRSGKTKMDTFEKIAEILEVPPYVFYDENFDVQMFRDYVVQGHHNPTSFFGPIYNGGEVPFPQKEATLSALSEMEEKKIKECQDLVKAKDETIGVLRKQVEDLLEDKAAMRSEIQALKAELAQLKNT
ncbi:MAG: helix-turn-helix domain-containing protein [Muribaculaceae bacterium]|nr:helix-turn-helix domain-containing protein [Muribaculaceae bacterium]